MNDFIRKYKMIIAGSVVLLAGVLMHQPSLVVSGATMLGGSVNVESPR